MDQTLNKLRTNLALKEWAATIKAIEAGQQDILFRKGGIIEKHDEFELEAETFYLYPTFLHQEPERIKPEHQHYLDDALIYRNESEKSSEIHLLATVVDVTKPKTFNELLTVLPSCIWSQAHLEKIWFFKPEKPCYILKIKTEKLQQPIVLPDQPEYAGCISWINFTESSLTSS